MQINIPEVTRTVTDFEFVFSSGMTLAVTVDKEAGDTVSYEGGLVDIYIAPKSTPSEHEKLTPAEHHTIFLNHVASSLKKDRIVVELTHEQKEAWKKVYKDVTKAIH